MLTYTFSRREKVLIALFSILLIVVGWYQLVYVTTTNQKQLIEVQIESTKQDIAAARTKLAKKHEMERIIEKRIAENAKATPIPDYDNIKPLMVELNTIMSTTERYSLTFEQIDYETNEYIMRGVNITYECDSYEATENLIRSIADGLYPCMIDSVSISTNSIANSQKGLHAEVNTILHVVFYERHPHTHQKSHSE